MDIIEIFRNIATIIGCITGVTTILMMVFKPLRSFFVNKIITTSKVNETENSISDLRVTIDNLAAELRNNISKIRLDGELNRKANQCILENKIIHTYEKYKNSDFIPAFEKDLVIEHYKLCGEFGSNGKLEFRYRTIMDKRID